MMWCENAVEDRMPETASKRNGCCGLIGGTSIGARIPEGLQRFSEANLKHGR